MGRVLIWLAEAIVGTWLVNSIMGSDNEQQQYYYEDTKTYYESYDHAYDQAKAYAEEFQPSPYMFETDDLDTVFLGSFNGRSAGISFSDIQITQEKDTIFFRFDLPYSDSNYLPNRIRGMGQIISEQESILLLIDGYDIPIAGIATKVYNEQDNEDYFFFTIEDEGMKLHFIDKKIKDGFEN